LPIGITLNIPNIFLCHHCHWTKTTKYCAVSVTVAALKNIAVMALLSLLYLMYLIYIAIGKSKRRICISYGVFIALGNELPGMISALHATMRSGLWSDLLFAVV